jgi:prepilin-type N-terminal cleavage/methylation domain-containing protein
MIGGFTLIELAIVLVVIGLLTAGALISFSSQVEIRRATEAERSLSDIKEALIGFAITNDRLPCPATATSFGSEAFASGGGTAANGRCADFFGGFLPARDLGVTPVDSEGFALDPWNNRIRYVVTSVDYSASSTTPNNTIDFTATGEMRSVGITRLSPKAKVCSTSSGVTATACAANASLVTNAVAVIFSSGPNAATSDPSRRDEIENTNGNDIFVSHPRSGANSPNGEFDDVVTWLSPNVLVARLVAAGRLP